MIEKRLLNHLLADLKYGQLVVTFWDGQERSYGAGAPQVHIEITTLQVGLAAIKSPSMAVGEGYMDGHIIIPEEQLNDFFWIITKNKISAQGMAALRPTQHLQSNRRRDQKENIGKHYDVGNDYYKLFLDSSLTYSCAYFRKPTDSLEVAQEQKLEHVLRKLRLRPGLTLLDIGCGWGHLAVTAAKTYGVRVKGITLSQEQLRGAKQLAERAGVTDLVEFELRNYQDMGGEAFDRIISVGMFEHVGQGQQATYFNKIAQLLPDGGVSVLHTITNQRDDPRDPWIDRYIFPGGYLATVASIEQRAAEAGLWSIDRENLWWHYARTLEEWRRRHRANREEVVRMYDERFYRMRDFWLAGSQAGFDYGELGLSQFIFTKGKPLPGDWPRTRDFMSP